MNKLLVLSQILRGKSWVWICVVLTLTLSERGINCGRLAETKQQRFELSFNDIAQLMVDLGFDDHVWLDKYLDSFQTDCYVVLKDRCDAGDRTLFSRRTFGMKFKVCCPHH